MDCSASADKTLEQQFDFAKKANKTNNWKHITERHKKLLLFRLNFYKARLGARVSNKARVSPGEQAARVLHPLTEGNREKHLWILPVATSAAAPMVRIKDSSAVSFPVVILQAGHVFTSSARCLIYSVKYNSCARQTLIRKSNTRAESQASCGQPPCLQAAALWEETPCLARGALLVSYWPPSAPCKSQNFRHQVCALKCLENSLPLHQLL